MAGTAWPALIAGQKARASDVELKFDWLERDLVPMLGGSTTTGVYDLGTSTAAWRYLHIAPTGGIMCSGATSMAFLADGTVKLKNGVAVNEISSDGTFASDSDLIIPTQKAVKTYLSGIGPHFPAAAYNAGTVQSFPDYYVTLTSLVMYCSDTERLDPSNALTYATRPANNSGTPWTATYTAYPVTSATTYLVRFKGSANLSVVGTPSAIIFISADTEANIFSISASRAALTIYASISVNTNTSFDIGGLIYIQSSTGADIRAGIRTDDVAYVNWLAGTTLEIVAVP